MQAFFVSQHVLFRCNNVLYVRGVEEDDEEGDMKE